MKLTPTILCTLASSAFLLATTAQSQPLQPYTTDKATAMNAAKQQGKLVLLIAGRDDCSNCLLVEGESIQAENPPCRQLVEDAFIYWKCPMDKGCTSYAPYVADQPSGFPLPLICIIDPSTPATQNSYVMRVFSAFTASELLTKFRPVLLRTELPQPTNLVNNTLNSLTLGGTMKYTNVPTTIVTWQLNGGGWSNAASGVNWAVPLSPQQVKPAPQANTISVYLKMIGGYKSMTNTINFIYDPNAPSATAPQITAQPVSQTIGAGSNVTFSVTATGTEPLSYSWRKGGVALVAGGRYAGVNTSALTIAGLVAADAGSYDVQIVNSLGNAISQPATLTVTVAPLLNIAVIAAPQSALTNGAGATFSIAVTNPPSAPTYQWFFNGVAISAANANFSGATEASLQVLHAGTNTAGTYYCRVTVGATVQNSPSSSLLVEVTAGAFFGLPVYGPLGAKCRLEYTTDLYPASGPVQWTPLPDVTLTKSPQVLIDESPIPSGQAKRFYQTVILP
jgi:hypothetical protein